MKMLVSINSRNLIHKLENTTIDGMIFYIEKLSVNSSCYFKIDEILNLNTSKKKYIVLNKNMHNNDLQLVEDVLNKIKDKDIQIMFYDMAVYNIAKRLGIVSKLVIYQDHLNTSVNSNKFYNNLGIKGSYVSNDITKDELIEIKNKSGMDIYFLGYGYQPIFYSRRYLINSYLDFIGNEEIDNESQYSILSDLGDEYRICEEDNGTTIYTKEPINLMNRINEIEIIDYIIINSNMIDEEYIIDIIKKYDSKLQIDGDYYGFFDIKTIYKIRKNVGDKNE